MARSSSSQLLAGWRKFLSMFSPRRHHEEPLPWSQELHAAKRLAAILSHEINNPLQGLTNIVYLLRQDAGMRPATQALLGTADELLDRMRRIAKQTLVLYGGTGVHESFDVAQILDELVGVFRPRIAAKQLRIQREYTATAVSGFRAEMAQAFSHLLSNAIEASPHGGLVILRVQLAAPGTGGETRKVYVEVEDFGPGIPPEDQPRVFEPFFITKADGSGLGLWASSQIVQKHGGTIEFRSGETGGRQGTCFSVVLPVEATLAEAA